MARRAAAQDNGLMWIPTEPVAVPDAVRSLAGGSALDPCG